MNADFFNSFTKQKQADWLSLINKELKGVTPETLDFTRWDTVQTNAIYQPAMRSTTQASTELRKRVGMSFAPNNWYVFSKIEVNNEAFANQSALNQLLDGTEAIFFNLNKQQAIDWNLLLNDIEIAYAPTIVRQWSEGNGIPKLEQAGLLKIGIPIKEYLNLSDEHQGLPLWALEIDMLPFANRYANLFDQLQLVCHHLSQLLSETSANLPTIHVHLGLDTDFLGSLSAMRAIRVLINAVFKSYKIEVLPTICVFAEVPEIAFPPIDAYNNLLRGTTITIAAAMGGADGILLPSFDTNFTCKSGLGSRMAKNTQLILKHESYLDQVKDPSSGSSMIEELTNQMIEQVWASFADLEEKQNDCLNNEWINCLLNKRLAEAKQRIASRKQFLLGVNQYPNVDDDLLEQALKAFKNETSLGAWSDFLQIQLLQSKRDSPILAGLVLIGDVAMRVARARFIQNFLGCGGIKCIEMATFDSIDALKATEDFDCSAFDLVVVCSDNAQWLTATSLLKPKVGKALLIIAGKPEAELEDLQTMGMDLYIHQKSHLLESLNNIINKYCNETRF